MPICLPSPRSNFPDFQGQVHVAGYQKPNNDPVCSTNGDGPDPYSLCKFPFFTSGLLVTGCITTTSPSGKNKICEKIIKQVTKDHGKFPPPGYSQVCFYI